MGFSEGAQHNHFVVKLCMAEHCKVYRLAQNFPNRVCGTTVSWQIVVLCQSNAGLIVPSVIVANVGRLGNKGLCECRTIRVIVK